MSEEVSMLIPVPQNVDQELGVLAACIYIIDRNPLNAGCSRELTPMEKERVAKYLAERFAPNGSEK